MRQAKHAPVMYASNLHRSPTSEPSDGMVDRAASSKHSFQQGEQSKCMNADMNADHSAPAVCWSSVTVVRGWTCPAS